MSGIIRRTGGLAVSVWGYGAPIETRHRERLERLRPSDEQQHLGQTTLSHDVRETEELLGTLERGLSHICAKVIQTALCGKLLSILDDHPLGEMVNFVSPTS